MMKIVLLIAVLFIAVLSANAQQNTVAAFGNSSSSGGSISFSVGQIDFTSLSNTANAGVQQSFDNSIPLPVTGLFIAATKQGKEVLISWETVTETNSSHFVVQRSTSSNPSFDSIGIVGAKGNSSNVMKYSMVDKLPVKGTNYYRLKQVDKDGKFIYSATVAVRFEGGITVSCYPNPTSFSIQLDLGTNNIIDGSYQLYDASGKLLQSAIINNRITIVNMEALKAATYIIQITSSKLETVAITIVKR